MAAMVDEHKPKPWRLKFSIATLLMLTTIAALSVAWWREKHEHARTTRTLLEERDRIDRLARDHENLEASIPPPQVEAAVGDGFRDRHRMDAHGPHFSRGGRGMHGNSEVKPQRTLKGGKLTELAPLTGKIETVPKGLAILSGSDGEVSGEV